MQLLLHGGLSSHGCDSKALQTFTCKSKSTYSTMWLWGVQAQSACSNLKAMHVACCSACWHSRHLARAYLRQVGRSLRPQLNH